MSILSAMLGATVNNTSYAFGRISHIFYVKVDLDPEGDARRVALNGEVCTVVASVAEICIS